MMVVFFRSFFSKLSSKCFRHDVKFVSRNLFFQNFFPKSVFRGDYDSFSQNIFCLFFCETFSVTMMLDSCIFLSHFISKVLRGDNDCFSERFVSLFRSSVFGTLMFVCGLLFHALFKCFCDYDNRFSQKNLAYVLRSFFCDDDDVITISFFLENCITPQFIV